MNSQNVFQLVEVLRLAPRLMPLVSRANVTLVSTSDLSSGRASAGVNNTKTQKKMISFRESIPRVRVAFVNSTCRFVCTMREG